MATHIGAQHELIFKIKDVNPSRGSRILNIKDLTPEIGVVIVTGTPELFEDRKFGIPSYEALYDRIRQPIIDDEHVNYQQPVLILRGLDKEKLLSIALRVRSIHAKAYSWEPNAKASDEIIDSAVNSYCYQFGRYQRKKPREFLRMFVDTLDRLHQHDDVRFEDFMSTDEDGLGS